MIENLITIDLKTWKTNLSHKERENGIEHAVLTIDFTKIISCGLDFAD